MNPMSEWVRFLSALQPLLDEILIQYPEFPQRLAEVVVQLKGRKRYNRSLVERCFEEAVRRSPIGFEVFLQTFGNNSEEGGKGRKSGHTMEPEAASSLSDEQMARIVDDTAQLIEELRKRQQNRQPQPDGVDRILSAEGTPPERATDREISVTGYTPNGAAVSQFKGGEMYRLRFRVDSPTARNLASGDKTIPEVPKEGLRTHWVVTSTEVEFLPALSTGHVQRIGNTWLAEFEILIPESGTSEAREVGVLASAGPGKLLVAIYALSSSARRELYREVTVNLVDQPAVEADVTCKALGHTHLGTTHEWTTPPEHIQILIQNGVANVSTKRVRFEDHDFPVLWSATNASISGAIKNVRDSLEKFREVHGAYLDDLEQGDIATRFQTRAWPPHFDRGNGWQPLPDEADGVHKAAFSRVQQSDEWRALAHEGYSLFNRCFPPGPLRDLFTKLLPGSRIDFHWTDQSGAGVVLHVPWALMYMEPVGAAGSTPIDPEKFLGLRFRIGSRSWGGLNGSVLLGEVDKAHSLHLLYWGDKPDDEVAAEARWQASEYGNWKQSRLLPDANLPDRRQQIILAIEAPAPSPVAVLYFYCHCSVGDGNETCLRFGNTSQRQDTLRHTDFSQTEMPDGPLVFANACSTAQADPRMASELEQSFFERGVRAFIGTETKVPVRLASKFAWIYFRFFHRLVDPEPMTAGEALTQTRLFLWTQFKNVGGLFYSITNQYDLCLASEKEIDELRRRGKT